MAQDEPNTRSGPMDRLKGEARGLVGALGDRALSSVRDRVEGASSRLTDYVEGGGGPGVMAAFTGARNMAEGKSPARSALGAGFAGLKEKVTGMFGGGKGGKGGGGKKLKVTNIVESIDVGVSVRDAYNQWTQFSDLPKFTKKLENVDQPEDGKSTWKAQVFWSHRSWEATIIEQVPDDRIIWRSKGEKGHVDGAITFHELAPNLTRILLVMEYYPQGLFERTGNLWRAQGRRARLEFKHFRRYMMTEGVLHTDEVEGWRGTIHDSEVTESHEDAMAREEREGSGQDSEEQDTGQDSAEQDSDEQDSGEEDSAEQDSDEQDSDEQRSGRDDADEDQADEDQARESGNGRPRAPARSRRSSTQRASGADTGSGDGRRQRARARTR
jgi:uncharacterized membrane protein